VTRFCPEQTRDEGKKVKSRKHRKILQDGEFLGPGQQKKFQEQSFTNEECSKPLYGLTSKNGLIDAHTGRGGN